MLSVGNGLDRSGKQYRFLQCFRRLAGIEPLNVLYNHPGYYLPYSKEGFEILDEVGSENIKMVFDIYHQQVSEGNVLKHNALIRTRF